MTDEPKTTDGARSKAQSDFGNFTTANTTNWSPESRYAYDSEMAWQKQQEERRKRQS